jgi:acetyltransferase
MDVMPTIDGSTHRYPSQWERHLVLHDDWRIFVRPVRPADELLIKSLLEHVTAEDLRLRFFAAIKNFSHLFLARLTDLDYAKAMAFIAFDEITSEPLGVVRVHLDATLESGEYAILLRSDLKGQGLGWALMQMIIEYARAHGLTSIHGQVLQQNSVMLKMCRELGFEVRTDAQDRGLCDVVLHLESVAGQLK